MILPLRRAALVMTLGFLVLLGVLVYWQVIRSQSLAQAGGNPRLAESSLNGPRGAIYASDGTLLAHSVEQPDGSEQRVYSTPSLAQTVGYVSTKYGLAGLESSFNGYLSGARGANPLAAIWSDVTRESTPGNNLFLTIDPKLQQIAAQALGNRRGAVIALDPRTGAVKAIVSSPTFNPNQLDQLGASLLSDPSDPLLNRATQGLYPPGSTYKTVTATAALDSGIVKPSDQYQCFNGIVVQGFVIACNNAPPGQTQWDFLHAYAYSINATFAQVALQLGPARFSDYSHRFGVGEALPFDIDTATSQILAPGVFFSDVLLASSGFGQGQLSVTPLQMALVAATVANNGAEPAPYLVQKIVGANGNVIEDRQPQIRSQVMSAATAKEMQQFMATAVQEGFGQEAGLKGLDVAGKSGTAETGTNANAHAWFIGYAPASAPRLAVAVIVENGGAGGVTAGPIAAQLFRTVLGK